MGQHNRGHGFIRRLRGGKAHGLVLPLVTTSGGTKFGKTEAGTIWLDPELTKPYQFYQFWFNTDDRDAVRYSNSSRFWMFRGFGARSRNSQRTREAACATGIRSSRNGACSWRCRCARCRNGIPEALWRRRRLDVGEGIAPGVPNVPSSTTMYVTELMADCRVACHPRGSRVRRATRLD